MSIGRHSSPDTLFPWWPFALCHFETSDIHHCCKRSSFLLFFSIVIPKWFVYKNNYCTSTIVTISNFNVIIRSSVILHTRGTTRHDILPPLRSIPPPPYYIPDVEESGAWTSVVPVGSTAWWVVLFELNTDVLDIQIRRSSLLFVCCTDVGRSSIIRTDIILSVLTRLSVQQRTVNVYVSFFVTSVLLKHQWIKETTSVPR